MGLGWLFDLHGLRVVLDDWGPFQEIRKHHGLLLVFNIGQGALLKMFVLLLRPIIDSEVFGSLLFSYKRVLVTVSLILFHSRDSLICLGLTVLFFLFGHLILSLELRDCLHQGKVVRLLGDFLRDVTKLSRKVSLIHRQWFLWAQRRSEERLFCEGELLVVHHLTDARQLLLRALGLFLVVLLRLYPRQHFNHAFGVFLSHGVDSLLEPVSVESVLGDQLLVDDVLRVLLLVLV